MVNEARICSVLHRKPLDGRTVNTTYKIDGGGIIHVKSIFGYSKQYKDVLFPAVLNKIKKGIQV